MSKYLKIALTCLGIVVAIWVGMLLLFIMVSLSMRVLEYIGLL